MPTSAIRLRFKSAMSDPATFNVDNDDIPLLRDMVSKLEAAGYSECLVCERLGLEDLSDLQWRHVPTYRSERLATRDSLDLAIDLFLLQGGLPAEEIERLFSLFELDLMYRAGLLVTDQAGTARARASIFPVDTRLIFSDHAWPELPHPGYPKVPSNHVMGIGRDSRNLARCTFRRRFSRALDLCTGSGIHALLASSHTDQVRAIDINPRAANCARFNARASKVTNLEVAVGDLYESVRGETFDLITANPPFVPSPLNNVQFRDGGRSGEDIQKRIIAGLPHHLMPGGVAQIVTELGERKDEPVVDRLRKWLNGAAIDIHILRLFEHRTIEYSVGHAKGDTYEAFLKSIDEWARNLRAQGYIRVVSLIISFQWSDATCGPPWEHIDVSPPPRFAAGMEIEAAFAAERATRRLGWQEILKDRWLSRAGPTALLDAQVTDGSLPAKAKATLLGRSLRIEHQLDPIERQILDCMGRKGYIAMRDLIAFSAERDVDESSALEATRSLLRRQLVSY
jgi:methylase of polypeptide subunit release factors